ncbi:hypothetical protein ACFFGT_25100 [Mucilaginibacter angelicae]|uniref:DUF3592 domain-containing protein n=1 Tax=Mucilaginibacter angelicae TaxID=869718 RepID=A0ABV6LDF8_9SPHI
MNKKFNTETEHTIKTGWKIFLCLFAGAIAAGGVYLIGLGVTGKNEWILLIVGIALTLFGVIVYLDIRATKIIISQYGIVRKGIFSRKELLITDIEGYGMKLGKLYLKPKSELGKKAIYLNDVPYFTNPGGISDWLMMNCKNLDAGQHHASANEVFNDSSLGNSSDEVLIALKKAKRLCSWLNYTGAAICIWVFVYPRPYDYAILTGIIYPLLMVVVFFLKRDTIILDSKRRNESSVKPSLYPSLSTALFMPLVGLSVRAFVDYKLVHLGDVFLPALIMIIILGVVFYSILTGAKEKIRSSTSTRVYATIFVIAYSFIVPVIVNCNFDSGEPKVYPAKIISQAIYENPKPIIYNLTLTKWGPSEGGDIEVSKSLYEQVKKGDTVHVIVKPGLFKMPWFYIAR